MSPAAKKRTKILQRIKKISDEKLGDLDEFLDKLELASKEGGIMAFSGKWQGIDEDVFDELTKELGKRRKAKRRND